MDDDSWVEQARLEAGPCPRCGSVDVRPVLYGLPDGSAYARLQDRVVFAGCLLPPDPHLAECGDCGAAWGRR